MWRLCCLRQSVKRTLAQTSWPAGTNIKQSLIAAVTQQRDGDRERTKTWCCLLLIFTTWKNTITQDDRSGAYDRATHKKAMALPNNTTHTYCITFYFLHKTFLFWLSRLSSSLCVTVSLKVAPVLLHLKHVLATVAEKDHSWFILSFQNPWFHGSTFTRQYSGHLLEIFKGKDDRMRAKNVITFSDSHRQNVEVDSDHWRMLCAISCKNSFV